MELESIAVRLEEENEQLLKEKVMYFNTFRQLDLCFKLRLTIELFE